MSKRNSFNDAPKTQPEYAEWLSEKIAKGEIGFDPLIDNDPLTAKSPAEFAERLRHHAASVRELRQDHGIEKSNRAYGHARIALRTINKARQLGITVKGITVADMPTWPELDAIYRALVHAVVSPATPAIVPAAPAAKPGDGLDDDSHLPPARLASLFEVPLGPLQSRLKRWRATADNGFIENPDRKPNEPQYVYRVGSIRRILNDLKATSERPAR